MFLFTFFPMSLIFTLVAARISHFLTAATKISCCSSNKQLLTSRSISLSLFLVELHWPVDYFTFSLYSTFVDMTINLSLIRQTTRIQKQFPLSVFVFMDSSVVSAKLSTSQDAGGYAISRQNNLELHFGCYTCQLSYFTLVCLWCGRTVGRAYGHVITKIFLTHGAPLRALRAREAPLKTPRKQLLGEYLF